MDERRVKIGVETGDLDSAFLQLRQRAEESVRSMISNSRALHTSSQDVIKDLEEQIKLQDKLSKNQSVSRELILQTRKDSLSPEQYSKNLSDLKLESREQALLSSLMRELIETVKSTSKQEIIEDRKTVEQTINSSKKVSGLSPEGDELENLKETVQRDLLKKDSESESRQRMDRRDLSAIVASNLVGPFMQLARQLVGSKNVNYFAADAAGGVISAGGSLLSMIPGLGALGPLFAGAGQLATSFFNRGLSSGEQFEEAGSKYHRITGRSVSGVNRSLLFEESQSEQERQQKDPAFLAEYNKRRDLAIREGEKRLEKEYDSRRKVISDRGEDWYTKKGTSTIYAYRAEAEAYNRDREQLYKQNPELETKGRSAKDSLPDYSRYGLNKTEYLEAKSEYARASSREGSLSGSNSGILAERALDLSRGQLTELAKSLRSSSTGESSGNQANLLMGTLATGVNGVGMLQARSYLPEYLSTLVSLNREQLMLSQKVDSTHNVQMIKGIEQLDKSFSNPEVLGKMVSSLSSGLSSAGTPQAEALQYSVLNRIAPGASLWQLQKMREKPFGKENEDYLYKTLEQISQMSSTSEESYQNTYGFFGGQISRIQAEKLMKGYQTQSEEAKKSGRSLSISDIVTGAGVSLESEAGVGKGTSYMSSQTKEMDNFFIEAGQKLIGYSKQAVDAVESIFEKIIGKSSQVKSNDLKGQKK